MRKTPSISWLGDRILSHRPDFSGSMSVPEIAALVARSMVNKGEIGEASLKDAEKMIINTINMEKLSKVKVKINCPDVTYVAHDHLSHFVLAVFVTFMCIVLFFVDRDKFLILLGFSGSLWLNVLDANLTRKKDLS